MKKRALIIFAVILVFALCSCVSVTGQDPIVGIWKTQLNDKSAETLYFTADGWYVREISYKGSFDVDCEFGRYSKEDYTIDIGENWYEYDYPSSIQLRLNDQVYRKSASKAVNNSSHLAGVWNSTYERIGFSNRGFAIAMGYYYNQGSYSIANNILTAKGRPSEYVIINENLYVRDFGFIGDEGTEKVRKYKQVALGGKDTSSTALLENKNIIFTNTGYTGAYINCYRNGDIVINDFLDLEVIFEFKGTFSFADHIITASNGDHFVFACIDGELLGYSYK